MKEPGEQAKKEVYLGDGLYASFDGFQIWLRAPRIGGDHEVALAPGVFRNLIDFSKGLGLPPFAATMDRR